MSERPIERARKLEGDAHHFLSHHAQSAAMLSVVAMGEYAEGFADGDAQVEEVRRSFSLLKIDAQTALIYARNCRQLRATAQLIGANDLWIAASAMRHKLPLVTRNRRHFTRLDGLDLISY